MITNAGGTLAKRKSARVRRDEARRTAERFAPEAGGWDVVLETEDEAEFRAHLHRLRSSEPRLDESSLRVDTFCGRGEQPTVRRLSRFVPHPADQ
ncbi:hypothetical protein ACF09C_17865 [Streptomyces sp. NPDC014870]|uniref:hypothetical protein n=1 Tax=Streptomyces sp. NPDC014870 TaxID=3364925 RepID=UPI0037033D52